MNYLKQIKITKEKFLGFLLLFSVPFIYFYPFSLLTLATSLFLGILLIKLISRENNNLYVIIFISSLIFAIFVSGHKMYNNIAIDNVTNSQRGEHPAFQTNMSAKILHNKSTVLMYYLQNLSDRLSISSIFASGSYPNISKYLPLGLLFPWYLIGFLLSIRQYYKKYLNYVFLIALSTLLIPASIFTTDSAQIFVFAVIWFIGFASVEQFIKLPGKYIYSIFFINLIYLGIFFLSYKFFLI